MIRHRNISTSRSDKLTSAMLSRQLFRLKPASPFANVRASWDGITFSPNATRCRELISGSQEISLTRSEEHTSELQSLMRISYAVFCLKKKNNRISKHYKHHTT